MMIYKNELIKHWSVEFYSPNGVLISTQGYCGSKDDVERFAEQFAKNIFCEEHIITER